MKVNKADALSIKIFVANQNNAGQIVTCPKILHASNIECSRRTLNNWMLRNDMQYRKQAQHIIILHKHKCERIRIVRNWIEKNFDWNHTIFMDEKRFSLDGPDNWYFVFLFFISFIIRCHRCIYVNKFIKTLRHRHHSSGGGIMVW